MVEFKTISEMHFRFGIDSFFDVESKIAITDSGDVPFMSLSRGYFTGAGEKKFQRTISFPNIDGIAEKVAKLMLEYADAWKKKGVE